MAVRASDRVTLATLPAITYARTYYLLQASTLGAPTKPTTNPPPAVWKTVEPTYTAGATVTLYTVQLSVYGTAGFEYGDVQKSSSYEAAKQAYNLATASKLLAEGLYQVIPSTTAPTTSPTGALKNGDQWWKIGTGATANQFVGVAVWNGSSWQDRQLVANSLLVPGSVGNVLIENGAVTAAKMLAGTITAASGIIADAAITNAKIANLDAAKITTGTLSASRIATDSLHGEKIIGGTITAKELAAESVTSAKILAENVTADKIASNAIIADKIDGGAVTAGKLSANAVIAGNIQGQAIDGMTITGAVIRTAATGQRVQLDTVGLRTFNASNAVTASLTSGDGGLSLTGSIVSTSTTGGQVDTATLGMAALQLRTTNSNTWWSMGLSSGGLSANGNQGTPLTIRHDSNSPGSNVNIGAVQGNVAISAPKGTVSLLGGTTEVTIGNGSVRSNRGLEVLYTSPGIFLRATQTVNLSRPVTSQLNGIVMAWSGYSSGSPDNHSWNYTIVPKSAITITSGSGTAAWMSNSGSNEAKKYFYVYDNYIEGNAINSAAPNNGWVLRYVAGF